MRKFLIHFLKFIGALSGPACMLYAAKLFNKYSAEGKKEPDLAYSVLVNNHGAYRYITEAQDRHFHIFLGLAILWIICLFFVIYITKFRK